MTVAVYKSKNEKNGFDCSIERQYEGTAKIASRKHMAVDASSNGSLLRSRKLYCKLATL